MLYTPSKLVKYQIGKPISAILHFDDRRTLTRNYDVKIVKLIVWTKGSKDEEEICGLRARYRFMNSEGRVVRKYG